MGSHIFTYKAHPFACFNFIICVSLFNLCTCDPCDGSLSLSLIVSWVYALVSPFRWVMMGVSDGSWFASEASVFNGRVTPSVFTISELLFPLSTERSVWLSFYKPHQNMLFFFDFFLFFFHIYFHHKISAEITPFEKASSFFLSLSLLHKRTWNTAKRVVRLIISLLHNNPSNSLLYSYTIKPHT